jgi:titin
LYPKGIQGLQAIADFEAKARLPDEESNELEEGTAPKFVKAFTDTTVTEGDKAYIEATLEPKEDSTIRLEWQINGKPLQESSRYKKVHSFGMVILEIGNVGSTDAGTYTCTGEVTLENSLLKNPN